MAELITKAGRKAIKKMVQVSQSVKALTLMPSAEDFTMRLIGDLRHIARRVNSISKKIDDILDKYSAIPTEFLLEGFDELIKGLDNINDYAKFAISETADVMSNTTKSVREITDALGNAVSATTSATLQIGGGLTYGAVAMSANIKLAMTGNGRRAMTNDVANDVIDGKVAITEVKEEMDNRIEKEVGDIDNLADSIRDWCNDESDKGVIKDSVDAIDNFFGEGVSGIDKATNWIDETIKGGGEQIVDNTIGVAIEKVENAKKEVEDRIERVKKVFEQFTQNFSEHFGFVAPVSFVEDSFRNASNTANDMDTPVFDAVGELTGEVADFIKNFNIGKVVTAAGGLVIGAATATLSMDLLPNIDIDRMLRNVIGGVDSYRIDKMFELYSNKYYSDPPGLLEVPDVPWRLSEDDLEKYNADAYEQYLKDFEDENNNTRSEILDKMSKVKSNADLRAVSEENREKMEENKSALKAMRKIRRNAIKAKQIEKYKGFLKIELDYLKRDCLKMKDSLVRDWDLMMVQYKKALDEIKKFFNDDGKGGNDKVDRCCDRINDDATQIVELCQSITTEITNAVAMVPTPYAIGTCVDMPVHKILAFFKDVKIIVTFLKNLIRLGIDIISQLSILAKLIFNGFQSLAEIMQTLKDLIGIDKIMNMIDFLIALFRPKLVDAKVLIENALSPIYYNETEDYEQRVAALEALLEDDKNGGAVDKFYYTNDICAKKNEQFGGAIKTDDDIEDLLSILEEKGSREIVAYRSPILNDAGDDFAGWIYYHAYAYDNMKKGWSNRKKRRRNKLINKASKKNKSINGRLIGGVAQLRKNISFGKYDTNSGKYIGNSVSGFDAYYWYTKWTSDPTDCDPDFSNGYSYDKEGNLVLSNTVNTSVVSPIQTTQNGSLVELSDGRRVFVEGKTVKSGDYVNVDGVKYKVK